MILNNKDILDIKVKSKTDVKIIGLDINQDKPTEREKKENGVINNNKNNKNTIFIKFQGLDALYFIGGVK